MNKKVFKYINVKGKSSKNIHIDSHKVLKITLITFTLFLIIEFILVIIEELLLDIELSNISLFSLFLNNIYLNIGFIGILGIFLSYYLYQKNKNLYYILLTWIIISFIIAFAPIFIGGITNFPLSSVELSERNSFMVDYWFNRIWFYSIPPLCIFVSIGVFKFLKKFKHHNYWKRSIILQKFIKNCSSLSLIVFSFSGIIFTGVIYGNANFRYTNNQINTLDWVSENIPIYSGVLVGDNFFMGVGVDSITFVEPYFMYDIFEVDLNETQCIEQIKYLKNETIQYAVFHQFFISNYLNKSRFYL